MCVCVCMCVCAGVYEEEVKVLGLYCQLLQEMLTSQLDRERQCNEMVCGRGEDSLTHSTMGSYIWWTVR